MDNKATVRTHTTKCCGQEEKVRPKQTHTSSCRVYIYVYHTTQGYNVKLKCGYCSLMGHAERHCRKKKRVKYKQKQEGMHTVTHESSVDARGTQNNTRCISQ